MTRFAARAGAQLLQKMLVSGRLRSVALAKLAEALRVVSKPLETRLNPFSLWLPLMSMGWSITNGRLALRTIGSLARVVAGRAWVLGRNRPGQVAVGPLALVLCVFAACASATATPTTATLRVKIVPIPINPEKPNGPSYPHTGNVLGEGAAFEGDLQIKGDEYGGFPPPLTGVQVFAPAGLTLHSQGFEICPQAILESHEVAKCPKRSSLTSVGSVSGVVSFGATRVHETLTLQAFFAAGGRVAFFAEGTSPASIEVLETGSIINAGGIFGPEFSTAVPLVSTVPEAPYAVVESVHLQVGAAYKKGSRLVPYLRLPSRCAKSGMPARVKLSFLMGAPVQIDLKLPCPAKR